MKLQHMLEIFITIVWTLWLVASLLMALCELHSWYRFIFDVVLGVITIRYMTNKLKNE